MQMMSLRLADSSVELSCWNLNRLEREGIREAIPWFDPNLQGAGFWVWKPFIILKELEHLEEGDYLLYTDAGRPPGRLFHHSLEPFVQWLREKGQDMMPGVNISYYTGGLTRWCKQSVFDELKLDSGSFEQAPLIQGSFLFLKKSEQSLRILREWMDLCRQFKLVSSATTEEESRCRDNFVAHTHDQTLLSLVAAQHHLDCLYSGKGVIHLEGRRAFERHPGFDDKDPDWFLEELGAKKAEHPLMPVLCCMQQAFFLYEKGFRKPDFNFSWGYMYGIFFCHMGALLVLLKATAGAGGQKNKPVVIALQWLAFFCHVVCGLLYFKNFLGGGMYY